MNFFGEVERGARNDRLDFNGDADHGPPVRIHHDPDPGISLKDFLFTVAIAKSKA